MPRSKSISKEKRAILYTRVSTHEQARQGYSLPDQEQRLRRYCEIKGIEVVHHFQDETSAKTFDRPEFNKLLRYTSQNRGDVDLILFTKWDRFSRNAKEALEMIDRLEGLGVEANAMEQPIDLTIPENKMVLGVYLLAPEVENDRRSLNTKQGMRKAKREGRWVSKAPKGYELEPMPNGKSKLFPDEEARYVQKAFAEMAKGVYTMEEVRRDLRDRGFECSKSQFPLLLRNPVYMGKIHVDAWRDEEEELVEGIHEPIVSEALFKKVQSVLDQQGGGQKGKPKSRKEQLPLRGHLKCKLCGGNLTGSGTTGNGGKYWYYHCQHGCKERFRADAANEVFVDHLDDISVAPEVSELYLAVMEDIFKEKEGDREQQIAEVDAEIEKLDDQLLEVDKRHFEGDLERDSYFRLKKHYTERREQKRARKRELERVETSFMKYARYGLSLVADLPTYYQESSLEIKQKLVGLIHPEKLTYDDGTYRTKEVNEVIRLLQSEKADFRDKNERPTAENGSRSHQAAQDGLEPSAFRSRAGCSAN